MDNQNPKNNPTPSTALAYLDPTYWDERFKSEEHYEWFKDYSHFQHLIQQHIPSNSNSNSSVLELGCGNSKLCEELSKDGITDITCIDLSPIAVENLRSRLLDKGYKDIKVLVADMLELPFGEESFDVVIEKGTMDVLFVDSGDPWNPRAETVNKVTTMLKEVHRVLKQDGIFISISFGQVIRNKHFSFLFVVIIKTCCGCYLSYHLNCAFCSHTLDAHCLNLQSLLGQLSGVLLVMDSTIFSIS
ncbi:hypothetical protein AQUCO_00700120v1 [Aquilegia coerulea]|uniref:Methyltransferase domain-containing protein n=1 Tax=Aquilegia coerulea TaxID=218851 RepID=A0A2G5EIM8_AQUCA|nr:hypothetical protein AQUCO_00700120v1 [Aquilegia coerulea]